VYPSAEDSGIWKDHKGCTIYLAISPLSQAKEIVKIDDYADAVWLVVFCLALVSSVPEVACIEHLMLKIISHYN